MSKVAPDGGQNMVEQATMALCWGWLSGCKPQESETVDTDLKYHES